MLATAVSAPTYDELVLQMGGGTSSTNGWDIVCSYGVDALNAVLADSHLNNTLVTEFSVSATHTSVLSKQKVTVDFDIKLAAPTLQFVAGLSGMCCLTMPILSATYKTSEVPGVILEQGSLPDGYSIVATVPLAATFGDSTVAPVTQGNVITFDTAATASMIIHFKAGSGTGTTFSVKGPVPSPENYDLIETYLTPELENYFASQVNEIDYCLTALTNKPKSDNDIVISPASFIFASDTDTLNLYIQTSNSKNPQGDLNPSFQPGGIETLPVPVGYTASIIFSQQFVENQYLLPQLSKFGTATIDPVSGSTDSVKGTHVSLVPAQSTLNIAPNVHVPRDNGSDDQSFSIDPIEIDFNKNPLQVAFVKNEGTVNWTFDQNLHWEWMKSRNPKGEPVVSDGNLDVSIALAFSTSLSTVTNDSFAADFLISPDQYKVSSPDGFWNEVIGDPSQISTEVQSAVPTFDFNFGSINFFAAANLLFPNTQTFKIDVTKGISVPGDLLLVGSID